MAKKKTKKVLPSVKLPSKTVAISWCSIDDAIGELKKLKDEGYTSIEGIDCGCYYKCCSCSCSSHEVK